MVKGSISVFNGVIYKLEKSQLAVKDLIKYCVFNRFSPKVMKKHFGPEYPPTLNLGTGHNYNLGLAFDQISGQLVTGNKWSNNASANITTRVPIFQNFTLRNRLKQSLLSLESNKL